MSYIPKLGIVVSVALVLASIGAISIHAQTQVENSLTVAAATPASTDAPKATDSKKSGGTAKVDRPPSVPAVTTTTSSETPVPQTVDADKWQFQFSPYFWLAGLHGVGGVGNRTTRVDESFSDVFDALNFAFMGTFEARKGKFISLTDLEYVSVSDDKATPGPLFSSVDAGFKTFIFDQEVGYRVLDNSEGATLDVFPAEPLPVTSPFWTHPNVTVTPHNAAASDPRALVANILRQIERFEGGLPLEHALDRAAGY